MSHACHRFWKCYKTLTFCSLSTKCRIPCTCQAKNHIWTFKSDPSIWCLYILTWKCASRQNGVHFFDIATSGGAPKLVCFVHFDLEMCFWPHRGVHFSTLQLRKVLRRWCALYILTWKCASGHSGVHFWTSQLPKVLRRWCALYILTWKRASRHSGVHFFDIATSKSAPTLVCFVRSFDFGLRGTTACTFSTSQLPKVLRTWGAFYVLTWVFEAARILSVRRLSKSHHRHHLPRPWQLFGWEKEPPASSAWGVKRSALQSMKSNEII